MLNQTLLNRYKITAALGKGAMGEVYAALDRQTGQIAALKVIAPGLSQDADLLQRFRREGEALRQLRHRNIVGFVDMFAWQGQQVIVMEYVPGGSLYARLKQGPLPLARVRELALDLCDALVSAHRLNIVHRDLKPENVLLTESGLPKLTDFGVARLLGEGTRLTSTGTQVGTPYYMSPEAWAGRPLDAQTDIWSLGVMLFEMLAGRPPFGGETVAAVMNNVLTAPVPDLKMLRPDVSDELAQVVQRALTRDLAQRYKTMRQMAVDLEQCSVPPLTPDEQQQWEAEKKALAAAADDNRTTSLRPPSAGRWKVWGALGGAALLGVICLLAGTGLLWAGSRFLAPKVVPTPSATRAVEVTFTAVPRVPQTVVVSTEGPLPTWTTVAARALPTMTPMATRTATPVGAVLTVAPAAAPPVALPVPINTLLPQSPRAITLANAGAVTEVGLIKTQGGGKVRWSPDGRFLAAASSDGLELYDGATFKLLRTLGDRQWLDDFAFLPDGLAVAVTGRDGVTIWRADTGGQVKILPALKEVQELAVSPDGKFLAVGIGQVVKLIDLANNAELATWPIGSNDCNLDFSPDGKWLATSGGIAGGDVVVYDVVAGKQVYALTGHSNWMREVIFSADRHWLASASVDQTAKLWDMTTGLLRTTFAGHTGQLGGVALSPDGTVVATNSWDLTVRLWDATTGQVLNTLTGHDEWAKAIAFSPDGALVASNDFGGMVRVWGLPPDGGSAATPTPRVVGPIPTTLALSPKAISPENVDQVKQLAQAEGLSPAHIAFAPDGQQVAASASRLSFFEPLTLKKLSTLEQASGSFAFAPDGKRLAVAGYDGLVLYQVTGGAMSTIFADSQDCASVAVSPDGALVAAVSGQTVKVWDAVSAQRLRTLPTGSSQGNVVFSPDGRRLAAAGGGAGSEIVVWDTVSWETVYTLKGHNNWITRLVFSPDGQTLASGASDNSLRFWDLTTGLLARTFPIPSDRGNQIPDLAFSPDGRLLVSSYGVPQLSIWEVASGTELRTLTGPTTMTRALAFSPDGAYLVTGDDVLRVWGIAP